MSSDRSSTSAPDYFDGEHLKHDLKGRSVRGGAVTFASQGVRFVITLGSTAVLARLLAPEDFGLVAMVYTVTALVELFRNMGLSSATVQAKSLSHEQSSTLFWVSLAISFLAAGVTCALAPAVAWLYGEPRVLMLTVALSSTLVFAGLTVQHNSILLRQMRFATHSAIYLSALIAGVVASITAAWCGLGYWSLALSSIVSAAANMVGVWTFSRWVPCWCWKLDHVTGMLKYGANIVGSNVLTYSTRSLDNVLIGWMWGAGPLAMYAKAYQILMMPLQQISTPMTRVAVPSLSRLQDDPERFRRHFCKALMLMVLLGMPTVAFTFVAAESIIHVVLGAQWDEAVIIFQLLGPAAFFGTFAVATNWAFHSLGLVGRQLKWGILSSVVTVAGFIVALPWGPRGVAASFSITYCILTMGYPALAYAFKGTPIRMSDFFASVWRATAASILAGVVLWFADRAIQPSTVPIVQLGLGAMIYTITYVAICVVLPGGRGFIHDMRRILHELKPRKPASAKATETPQAALTETGLIEGVSP